MPPARRRRGGEHTDERAGGPSRIWLADTIPLRQLRRSRERWAASIGVSAATIVAVRQVHGSTVDIVTAAARGRGARDLDAATVPAADAILTATPDTPLLLGFADCTPLLFHDPQQGVVGLAHAGWRGTVADIAGETVRALVRHFGSDPARIIVGIGPAIGACCYGVDTPVIAAWEALGVADPAVAREVAPQGGRRQWRFDLARANRRLLERAGIAPDQIEDAALCTASSWPRKTAISAPSAASHTRAVLSQDAVTMRVPSGENAALRASCDTR